MSSSNKERGSGLKACEDAFQRLCSGKSLLPEHMGISQSKVTAGIVSVEAGFDRGYLKKSRKAHQSLIAKIEEYRISESKRPIASSTALTIKRAHGKVALLEAELALAQEVRDKVLTQNLQLYERVRELEGQIKRFQSIELHLERVGRS